MKIEVTEEQYEAFINNRESITLVPPKKEYNIEYGSYNNEGLYSIVYCDSIETRLFPQSELDEGFYNHGRYRKTKENAEYSLKRNQRANRLESLVEDLQGELGVGDFVVYEAYGVYKANESTYFNVGDIRMKKETAEKVCELLNSGKYSLEG